MIRAGFRFRDTGRRYIKRLVVSAALGCCTCFQVSGQIPDMDFRYIPGLPEHAKGSHIFQDSRGLLWIAYDNNGRGLYLYDGQNTRQIRVNPSDSTSLPDGNVEELLEMPDGKIWMATLSSGVCIYDPAEDEFSRIDLTSKVPLQFNTVRHLEFDDDGALWMACRGGLVRHDTAVGSFELFSVDLSEMTREERIDANRMHYFIEDPSNPELIWIGGLGGLLSFDRSSEQFQFHRMPYTGMRAGRVNPQVLLIDLVFLSDTVLVMGSWAGGIMTYNTRQAEWSRHLDPAVPAVENVYHDLEVKSEHEVWINCHEGFGVFSFQTEQFAYYDSIPIPFRYPGGRYATVMQRLNPRDIVVIGSSGGIVGHFRDSTPGGEHLYPPLVRSIVIDGEQKKPDNALYTRPAVEIGQNQGEISFQVVAPRYFQPDSVYYRYQLAGMDRNWQTARGSVNATYEPAGGNYELRYQASLDGVSWIDGETWKIEKYVSFWQSAELRYVLGAVILAGLVLYWFLTFRQKRKQAELEKSYKHLLAESEMTALRAQMNPHFIFNSLNSIKMHVMKQDTEVANRYLTRFSHLMRLVLRNSKSKLITLADELQALELYIEIEKLRFDDGFDSSVEIAHDIDPESLYIPPMLVQPYVENAIWHGLMHKKVRGALFIRASLENGNLHLIIEDDGVGRAHTRSSDAGDQGLKKSYGMRITHDRIALIRQSLGIDASVQVDDLVDDGGAADGTRVHLTLPAIGPKQASKWLEEPQNAN